jgi:predicted transcriptional regulator
MGLVVLIAASADAQDPRSKAQQPPHAAGMAEKCTAMMAQHEKMMAEMKAADERLDQLVARMKAESGDARVDAIAAVVAEIVAQRRAMRDRMMSMHETMMGHMMEHMQAGPESMATCPMMKMRGMMKKGERGPNDGA